MADVDTKVGEETLNKIIERAKKFLFDGCGCSRGSKGGPCSREFKEEAVLFNLNNCRELTKGELNLIILVSIQAFGRNNCIGSKKAEVSCVPTSFSPSPYTKKCLFTFLASVITNFLNLSSITRDTVSIRELTATPKHISTTLFHSQSQKTFIVSLLITLRRMHLCYL